MYFNSYEFIFLFLPCAIGGYFLFGKTKHSRLANIWLLLASLFFYGYWEINYLPVLLTSIAVNFAIIRRILAAINNADNTKRKAFFYIGLTFNVFLLGYYKYTAFILENVNLLCDTTFPVPHIDLPLGISFFTITQLVCLYDCYAGNVKKNGFFDYALFVSFFPHLLAGPILYHRAMMRQFQDEKLRLINWDNMAEGLTLFIIGLVKKVVVADSLIVFVNNGFANAENLTLIQGWFVSFGYIVQLYFDFSGYSDMAIGMAKMMNITIPINFNSPFRAKSLIEFWQRWHISLTNAITGCLYQPLLRSFARPTLQHVAFVSFVTFFIIGVWHGAGWTYVGFALLHAFGIVVNHIWRWYKLPMPRPLSNIVTIVYLAVTLVFFRADNVTQGFCVLKSMLGLNGITLSTHMAALYENIFGVAFTGGVERIFNYFPWETFVPAILLMTFSPSSTKLIKRLKPSPILAVVLVISLLYAVSKLGETTDFLYFQF